MKLSENIMLLLIQGWLESIILLLALLKEVWTWGEVKISSFCFSCYQGNEETLWV